MKVNVGDNLLVCKIELTLEETKAILHSLGRTMCSGKELTISEELEDKLVDVLEILKKKYYERLRT